ncbi:MAG: DUF4421 family protein [Bdellovibrionota bacterium]|nr:DUF4421 family protein [Bdellovibrionota bacterium]
MAIGAGLFNPSLKVNVGDENDSESIQFSPNNASTLNLIFSYGNLGLDLKTTKARNDDDNQIDIDTKYHDIQLAFYGGKHNYLVTYQEYKGYYVSNPEEVDSNYTSNSPESLFPDMETRSISFRYFRVFNSEKFNLDSAYGIVNYQEEKGGSWILGIGGSKDKLKSPNKGFSPSYANTNYQAIIDLKKIDILSINAQGGYSYTYVYKSLYANAIFMLGASIQQKSLNYSNEVNTDTALGFNSTVGISFGMNKKKHKLNLQVFGISNQIKIDDKSITSNLINVGIVYAYRFGDKNIPYLSNVSKWLEY